MEKPAQNAVPRRAHCRAELALARHFRSAADPAPREGVSSGLPRAFWLGPRSALRRVLDRPRYTGCTDPRRSLWGKTTPFQGG